ncbi:MAG: response regulator [Leptolyngbyaceae cyanobacterium]
MRILLVEDDGSVAAVLEKGLANEHYAVDIAENGQLGWQMVNSFEYDLVMLDVMLPEMDGLQLCQKLRDHSYHMPVLLLTALDSNSHKIAGLNAGADDYITKPFELEELFARVRALLRRGQTPLLSILEWEDLQLDPNSQEVTYGDRPVKLTPKEFRLLELFLRKQSQVFTRSGIIDRLWDCSKAPGEDTVTAHIRGLRQKLVAVGAPGDLIKTVYGIGYRLKPARSSVTPAPLTVDPASDPASEPASKRPAPSVRQQQTQVALATLWQSAKAQNLERLTRLKQMLQALQQQQATDCLRPAAIRAAHSLAGALGIFGLHSGSEVAYSIEKILTGDAPIPTACQHQLAQLISTLEAVLNQGVSPAQSVQSGWADPLLVIVDDDLPLVAQVAQALSQQGLKVQTASDETALSNLWPTLMASHQASSTGKRAPTASEATTLDIIVLKLALDELDCSGVQQLSRVINKVPSLLVLVCSQEGSLTHRVKAAQLGSQAFLADPDVAAVLKSVFSVRSQGLGAAHKVMVVDDDPQTLTALQTFLEPKGFKLITLSQPLNFWATLQRSVPDLLLLDIEMPRFNGLELCRTVRQAPFWSQLPIIFLTIHGDVNTKAAALRAGANDLVEKSLAQSTLLDRLFEQLKQSQLQRAMAAMAQPPR